MTDDRSPVTHPHIGFAREPQLEKPRRKRKYHPPGVPSPGSQHSRRSDSERSAFRCFYGNDGPAQAGHCSEPPPGT